MKNSKCRKKELKAVWLLWNWTCLGACGTTKTHDRWLKALKEIENELNRYQKEGCKCKQQSDPRLKNNG